MSRSRKIDVGAVVLFALGLAFWVWTFSLPTEVADEAAAAQAEPTVATAKAEPAVAAAQAAAREAAPEAVAAEKERKRVAARRAMREEVEARAAAEAAAEDNKSMALVMAQGWVKDRLKSPGTADFGGVWGGDFQRPDDCVTVLDANTFRVRGWVDAQNGFGATVRTDFNCKVMDLGNGEWKCLDIQMNQR